MASPVLFGMINFLHDFFTALWIGGLAFTVLILMPVVKKYFEEVREGEQFLNKTQKRLKIIVYISMVGLAVTGILMSRQALTKHIFDGPFSFTNTYSTLLSVKHILTILMVAIGLTRSQILDRLKTESMALMKSRKILIVVNLVLGVAVLVLSGMGAAYGAIP